MRRITLPMILIWLAVGIWLVLDGNYGIVLFVIGSYLIATAFIFGIGWLLSEFKK